MCSQSSNGSQAKAPLPNIQRCSVDNTSLISVRHPNGFDYLYSYDSSLDKLVPHVCTYQAEVTEADLYPLYSTWSKKLLNTVLFVFNTVTSKTEQYVYHLESDYFEQVENTGLVYNTAEDNHYETVATFQRPGKWWSVKKNEGGSLRKVIYAAEDGFKEMAPSRVQTLSMKSFSVLKPSCPHHPSQIIVREDNLVPMYAEVSSDKKHVIHVRNSITGLLEQYYDSDEGLVQVDALLFNDLKITTCPVIIQTTFPTPSFVFIRNSNGRLARAQFCPARKTYCSNYPMPVKTFVVQRMEEEEKRRKQKEHRAENLEKQRQTEIRGVLKKSETVAVEKAVNKKVRFHSSTYYACDWKGCSQIFYTRQDLIGHCAMEHVAAKISQILPKTAIANQELNLN